MELSRNRSVRYDEDLRGIVARICGLENDNRAIATEFGISINLVRKYKRNIKSFGTHLPPSISQKGPRPRIVCAAKVRLLEYISSCEQCPTLNKMCTLLAEEFNIKVTVLTISRCIKKLNMTYKRGERTNP